MAKKSRRARRQQPARPASSPPATAAPAPRPVNDLAAAVAPAPRQQVDFRTEYRYVVNDLRSMAVIALGMLAVLIALSFVVR